jgi:hypothetical protein
MYNLPDFFVDNIHQREVQKDDVDPFKDSEEPFDFGEDGDSLPPWGPDSDTEQPGTAPNQPQGSLPINAPDSERSPRLSTGDVQNTPNQNGPQHQPPLRSDRAPHRPAKRPKNTPSDRTGVPGQAIRPMDHTLTASMAQTFLIIFLPTFFSLCPRTMGLVYETVCYGVAFNSLHYAPWLATAPIPIAHTVQPDIVQMLEFAVWVTKAPLGTLTLFQKLNYIRSTTSAAAPGTFDYLVFAIWVASAPPGIQHFFIELKQRLTSIIPHRSKPQPQPSTQPPPPPSTPPPPTPSTPRAVRTTSKTAPTTFPAALLTTGPASDTRVNAPTTTTPLQVALNTETNQQPARTTTPLGAAPPTTTTFPPPPPKTMLRTVPLTGTPAVATPASATQVAVPPTTTHQQPTPTTTEQYAASTTTPPTTQLKASVDYNDPGAVLDFYKKMWSIKN